MDYLAVTIPLISTNTNKIHLQQWSAELGAPVKSDFRYQHFFKL